MEPNKGKIWGQPFSGDLVYGTCFWNKRLERLKNGSEKAKIGGTRTPEQRIPRNSRGPDHVRKKYDDLSKTFLKDMNFNVDQLFQKKKQRKMG